MSQERTVSYPTLGTERLIQRLTPPTGRVRMVLDTDTYNEIDDQFAVVYALLAREKLEPLAFYAAPFFNSRSSGPADGMEKSYEELVRILGIMEADEPVHRGSDAYLPGAQRPVESAAARDLVDRALAAPEDEPLYVVAIGAITNVASAILMEPAIIKKIVVVWLGSHALQWPHTREFNFQQDLHASRVVLDSGVPLVLIPCMGVASHLQTTLSQIRDCVRDHGDLGAYLYEIYREHEHDDPVRAKVIWDISAVAYLIEPDWLTTTLIHSPRVSDDFRWSLDRSRHFIRYVEALNRNAIFADLFRRIAAQA